MDKEKQIFQMQKKGFEDISKNLSELKPKDVQKVAIEGAEIVTIKGKQGEQGKDGYTPIKGKDYFTKEEQSQFVDDIMGRIRIPIDGKDGKDAEPVDYSKIEKFVIKEIAKIPRPEIEEKEEIDTESIVQVVLKKIPKQKEIAVDYPAIKEYCRKEIQKIEENRDARYRTLNSGGPTTRLGEISDVNVEKLEIGQVLRWNGSVWLPYTPETDTDVKVKVTTNDTTAGFLDSKISVSSGLTKSITNPSGNEVLNLAVDTSIIQPLYWDRTGTTLSPHTAGDNILTTGSITGNSLVTAGGTSSQFVKGDGSLDSSTYLTSLSGALLATGATTGATSQSQVFTNGITNSLLTSGRIVFSGASGVQTDSANLTWSGTVLGITGDLTFATGATRTISLSNPASGNGNTLALLSPSAAGTAGSTGGFLTLNTGTGSANTTVGTFIQGGAGGNISLTTGIGGDSSNGSQGTVGGPGGNFAVTTGTGGSALTVGAFGTIGGASGNVNIQTGNGKANTLSDAAASGGSSGAFNMYTGQGGSGGTGTTIGNGATSGQFTMYTGSGGAAGKNGSGGGSGSISIQTNNGGGSQNTNSTGTNQGGVSGGFTMATANGGIASGSSGTNTGGTAGALVFTAGNGGSGTGGTNAIGGTAGYMTFTAGNGGTVSGGGTLNTAKAGGYITYTAGNASAGAVGGTGANGGYLKFTAGNASTAAGLAGNGGDVFFLTGAKSPTGTAGNIYLGSDGSTVRGSVAVGMSTAPTALLHIGAGTATAGTAPLKFTSGVALTTAEAGAVEFNTATNDDLWFTITTGAARKNFILGNGANLTSGKIPIASTNGRLIDGQTPLAGTKVYYVSDSSGGAVTRKLTFIDGILVSET